MSYDDTCVADNIRNHMSFIEKKMIFHCLQIIPSTLSLDNDHTNPWKLERGTPNAPTSVVTRYQEG